MIALEKPAMWASAASWSLGLGIASNAGFWDSGVQEQQQSSWSQMTQKPVTWETHGFDFALQATSQTRLDAAWTRNQPANNQPGTKTERELDPKCCILHLEFLFRDCFMLKGNPS